MGTHVVTGAAGGIGSALRERLEGDGHTVIGVDVRDAEVIADLATVDGRAAMVDGRHRGERRDAGRRRRRRRSHP